MEQVGDVACVELAGVERHGAGDVGRAVDADAVHFDHLSRPTRSEPRRIPATMGVVRSLGACRPGIDAVVITTSLAATCSASLSRCLFRNSSPRESSCFRRQTPFDTTTALAGAALGAPHQRHAPLDSHRYVGL